jgi:hypothetical protein
MVAEKLAQLGVSEVIGVDILPDAAAATERDRPGVYRDYFVVDLRDPPVETRHKLTSARFDCVMIVGALGFDDGSPDTFVAALSYVTTPGWAIFSIKEQFVSEADVTGFGPLIARSFSEGALTPVAERRYRHRYSVSGQPLYYVAFVAEKVAELSHDWVGVSEEPR